MFSYCSVTLLKGRGGGGAASSDDGILRHGGGHHGEVIHNGDVSILARIGDSSFTKLMIIRTVIQYY
jgi:hypothetical protein